MYRKVCAFYLHSIGYGLALLPNHRALFSDVENPHPSDEGSSSDALQALLHFDKKAMPAWLYYTVFFLQIVILAGALILFIWLIHLFSKFDGQPCGQPLALWSLVMGVTGVSVLFLVSVLTLLDNGDKTGRVVLKIFLGLLYLFAAAWVILGAIWTSTMGFNNTCPAPLFQFVFYFNFVVLAVLAGVVACVGSWYFIAVPDFVGTEGVKSK